MNKPVRLITPHRLARLVRWAQAMLAWLALAMFSEAMVVSRRRIRQRFCFASIDWAARLVRKLALVRAVEIAQIRARPRPPLRNAAPAGFRRRIARAGLMRAMAGARFRKALKARDLTERIARLLAALADIDGFARRYLVARARMRLTKLHAVVMFAPPADALVALAAPEPRAADTS